MAAERGSYALAVDIVYCSPRCRNILSEFLKQGLRFLQSQLLLQTRPFLR